MKNKKIIVLIVLLCLLLGGFGDYQYDQHKRKEAYDTAEEALARRGKRGEASDRIELAGLKFQEDVRRGYLELAKDSGGRIVTIDAMQSPDEIFGQIMDTLEGKI